jgi:hypothetical protein
MSAVIATKGLTDVAKFFDELPDVALEAAFLAVRDVSEGTGLRLVQKEVERQVNFPKGYVQNGRLTVKRKASRATLEAVISGRDRPTSLARFAPGQTVANSRGRGVIVEVHKGSKRNLGKRAFIVNLRNGNQGLALRLKPGEVLRGSDKAVRLDNNLFLLYGPSVDQVFRGVAESEAPVLNDMVQRQFLRQFARLTRRG